MNPLVNASIKYSAIISIHIYDGIVYTQEHFGLPLGSGNGRRLLSDTSALGYSETLMAGLEPFMELVLIVCEAILVISTAVIDIFFEIGLLSFLGYFLVIAVLVITKVICIFAGGWCTLLEIADFFVNTLVLGLFNLIANAFGQSIPKIPIACVASQLAAAGSQCAGSVFSIDPPGFFSGLLNQRRLLSVSCDEVGGVFRESFGDTHVHETNNKSLACPHARSSFHPYGHALNMASLNTHDCYEVCVNRVKYEACENGEQYFIGTCGPIARKNITIVQARRRLDDFFNMNTFLKDREMVSKVNEMYSTPVTRFEAVDMLKNLIGFKFSLGGLQCDLTQSPTNIQEIVVDAGCLIGKFWSIQQTKQKNGGRRLEEANLINMVNIDEIRHKARMWKTHVTEYDHHPAHAEVNKSPLFQLKTGLQRHHTVERSSTSFKPVNIPRMEKSTVFAHGFVRIPTNIQGRRRLEALIECPVGERLCANMINCVTDYSQCPDAHSYSVITWVVYHFEKATISLETFNLPFVVKSLIDCFRLYESNPETDPLAIGSLTKSETDRINECVWCFPMLPPYTYSHQVAVFSLRDVIAATCNSYSNQYKSCQCPMFFDLPENSVPLTMFMDEDLGYIVANCLIFYKNLWIFVVGDWIGLFW